MTATITNITFSVQKIPGGQRMQVFTVTIGSIALCGIPVWFSGKQKAGHDLFSQEKPEAIQASQDRLQRERAKRHQ